MPTDRHRITMTNFSPIPGGFQRVEATDHVAAADIAAYVADAQTRWALVEVSEEIDNGPAGDSGDYTPPTEGI